MRYKYLCGTVTEIESELNSKSYIFIRPIGGLCKYQTNGYYQLVMYMM